MRLFTIWHQHQIFLAMALVAAIGFVGGCGGAEEDTKTAAPAREVTLKVLAVDSPAIAAAAARLWSAEGMGQLELTEMTQEEFAESQFEITKEHDAVIYPSVLLADLVANDFVIEIPKEDLDGEVLNRPELLPHQRKKLLHCGRKVWSAPLGNTQLMLMYNKSDFEELKLTPPKNWIEFEEVAKKLKAADKQVRLPLAQGWSAEMLLARVAALIRAQGKLSTVFDVQTMKPHIATEPFIDALNGLKKVADAKDIEANPESVYRSLVDGTAAMGITWPSKHFLDDPNGESDQANEDLALARLPGSMAWYNQSDNAWEQRSEGSQTQVDVIGGKGRLVSVSKGSRNARVAMDFTCWLGSKSASGTVSIGSENVSMFRSTHLGQPAKWAGAGISYEAAAQFGDIVSEISESQLSLQFPRIALQHEYLEILDSAVLTAVRDEVDASKCLAAVAQEWEKLTELAGREEQQKRARRSVGF